MSGPPTLDPRDLLRAVLAGDSLGARQWVKDAEAEGFSWSTVPPFEGSNATERAVYAGLIELMASRRGESPPSWTSSVG
jgi:hypothetical protein